MLCFSHELTVNIIRTEQRLQNSDSLIQENMLTEQSNFLMEDPNNDIETDDEYLDAAVAKIMDSKEFKEIVLPSDKRRTSMDVSTGDSDDDEISIIETSVKKIPPLFKIIDRKKVIESDSHDQVLDVDKFLTNDTVINRSINIFQDSNIGGKLSIIDRLVKPSPLDVQQKVLTHIFQMIQKTERQTSKESDFGEKKPKYSLLPAVSDESECSICGATVQSNLDLALHIKQTHEQPPAKEETDNSKNVFNTPVENKIFLSNSDGHTRSFDNLATTVPLKKISKVCYICEIPIAGSGRGWRFPLYTHFSRKHFSRDLYRDFKTEDNKCSLCGKEEESVGRLVAHLGATHKLVERYLDRGELSKYDRPGRLASASHAQVDIWEEKQKQLQLKLETNIGEQEMTEHEIAREDMKKESLPENMIHELSKRKRKLAPSGNIPCHLCDKKLKVRSVLMSHLMVNHFKYDCEEAIKQVLEHSGDVCPLCPDRPQFTRPFDWKVFLHFSRTHKIAENLTYSQNQLNFENVQKILQIFFP